jgi:hypothetical protein
MLSALHLKLGHCSMHSACPKSAKTGSDPVDHLVGAGEQRRLGLAGAANVFGVLVRRGFAECFRHDLLKKAGVSAGPFSYQPNQFRMTTAVPKVTKANKATTSQSRFESQFIYFCL